MSSSDSLERLGGFPVMVTGGTGFIGAHLVRRLVGAGARVTVISRDDLAAGRLGKVADQVTHVNQDLRRGPSRPPSDWPVPRAIFHLAARGIDPRESDLDDLLATNVAITVRMLQLAVAWKVERFVHFGSCGEYGSCHLASEETLLRPDSAYGATKAASSLLVRAMSRQFDLPSVVLRPFSVYGPEENPHRLVSDIAVQALRRETIEFTDGLQTRDFIYVDDVVDVALAVLEQAIEPGEVFNVCTGIVTPVRDLVRAVIELSGGGEARFGARSHPPAEMWHMSGNPAKAERRLGWTARVPLRDGLLRTIEWLRARPVSGKGKVAHV